MDRPFADSEKVYSGAKALELYLQAYQLILRKQCWTLVNVLRLPAEIGPVLKDLWELRLQLLADRLQSKVDNEVVFSSQQESETDDGTRSPQTRKRWDTRGKETPKGSESLALCYMAMIILRLPFSLGDLFQ